MKTTRREIFGTLSALVAFPSLLVGAEKPKKKYPFYVNVPVGADGCIQCSCGYEGHLWANGCYDKPDLHKNYYACPACKREGPRERDIPFALRSWNDMRLKELHPIGRAFAAGYTSLPNE
jgi:hypothetical protein